MVKCLKKFPSVPPSPRVQVGSNDRKKELVVELVDKCGPSLVIGRMADIYALGQIVVERGINTNTHLISCDLQIVQIDHQQKIPFDTILNDSTQYFASLTYTIPPVYSSE